MGAMTIGRIVMVPRGGEGDEGGGGSVDGSSFVTAATAADATSTLMEPGRGADGGDGWKYRRLSEAGEGGVLMRTTCLGTVILRGLFWPGSTT